jgi:hypothetical protein
MHDLLEFVEANSALVLANPAVFATFAVLFGGGGFIVGRYLLTERIANLESRIARRDEEIAELKGEQKAPRWELPMVPLIGTAALYQSEPERLPMPAAQLPAQRKGNQRV